MIGALLLIFWGIAHLLPTKNVVRDFGEISIDNRRIISMEWINEGAALIFIGVIVGVVTVIDSSSGPSIAVYILSSLMLVSMSLISFFTGFKIKFIPFKLCPLIFLGSAVLITLGSII